MVTALAKDLSRRDTTFYPVEDDMGEEMNHREIADLLRALLKVFLSRQGKVARVGANQFIYWVQGNPQKTIAPDVYVLPGVDPETGFGCWKVWETGIAPSFALEVVSQSIQKDYVDVIERYRELGTSEVIIFDPRAGRASPRRVRWQVYRRIEDRGLVLVESSSEDRIKSRELDCWLRALGKGDTLRVRVATGPKGDELLATAEEAKARAEAEAARLRAENEELKRRLALAEASAPRRPH